jgi:hypothetical protein
MIRRNGPFAFFFDMIEAAKKIGPLRITPGRARRVQTISRPRRYRSRPRVFQVAFRARGTYITITVSISSGGFPSNGRDLMIPQSKVAHQAVVLQHVCSQGLDTGLVFEVVVPL